MTGRTKKIVGAAVLIALVGGVVAYMRSGDPDEGIETERVVRADVSETVSVTGELSPLTFADISFTGSGRIVEVAVKEGDAVMKGDRIARLDSEVFESQLREAYVAADIAVAAEQLARRSWDDLEPEERTAKKLASEQARERVRTIHAQLAQTVIVAPMDGYVSKLDARVGETAIAGNIIGRIAVPGGYRIEARIPESDVADLRAGMRGTATFDALSRNEKFDVTLTDIDRSATTLQDVVSYVGRFGLDAVDERLRDGMTADIDIETARRSGVLTVPFRAITREGGKTSVELRLGVGSYERREVTIGLEGDEGVIEVLSGLAEGDEVVVSRK